MSNPKKKVAIYFDPKVLQTLQHKALQTNRSVSDLVNAAVVELLAEDAEDLAAFEERVNDPLISYEGLVNELKANGRL